MKKLLLVIACLFFPLISGYSQCQAPNVLTTTFDTGSVTFQISMQGFEYPAGATFEYALTAEGAPDPTINLDFEGMPTANPIVITQFEGQPLEPATAYVLYMKATCSETEYSQWSVFGFVMPPTHDKCNGAVNVPVNPGQQADVKVFSSNTGASGSDLPDNIGCSSFGDVWFSFVATSTTHAITFGDITSSDVTPGNTFRQNVMSGTCGNLSLVYCSLQNNNTTIAKNLTVGNTYYVQFNCINWVNFSIAITSQPENDECTTAAAVPVNPIGSDTQRVIGNTLGATASPQDSGTLAGCASTDDDVWYTFTATSPTHVIHLKHLESASSSANHSVYSGDCGSLTLLYCSNPDLSVAKNLIVGNEYKIRVFTASASNISFQKFELYITTPPVITNDECANAIPLPVTTYSANPVYTNGTLTGATSSSQPSTCAGSDDDVWYTFQATSQSHIIQFTDIEGSVETIGHALYSGSCGNLAALYCKTVLDADATNLIIGNFYTIRVFSIGIIAQDVSFKVGVFKAVNPISVGNQFTATQLVNNVLLDNPCISTSNITFGTGLAQGILGLGYFTSNTSTFPIASGVVLATGAIAGIPGPNSTVSSSGADTWLGDAQLDEIVLSSTQIPMNSKNATKLEFDFTTANAYMSFNFLFASEEYGQFQCTFSDAFAFLLTDLTTGITTNLAVVPNTNIPISAVTIRDDIFNTQCESVNPEFFDHYYGANTSGAQGLSNYLAETNFNGVTKLMTASSALVPNNPYHIKLVVADRQDSQYDSAVFIQGGSFTSGPPECSDKIRLTAFVDTNGNGIKEDDEFSFTHGSFVYQLNDAPETNHISSPIGNYTIYDSNPANSYDFSFVVNPEYQTYFGAVVTNINNITIPTGSGTNMLYFPVTILQGYNDVTVSIVPVSPPVAGMSFKNKIVYTNNGIAPASGTITFMKDPVSTIAEVSEMGTLSIPGGFTYNFADLAAFESRSIEVTMSIPPIPTVNIDDVLSTNASISAAENDINNGNNTFANTQVVVASYDPNDKNEAHGEKIEFSNFGQNDYLTYTIRFQNTGTSNAINIRLEDLLDAQFDEASIRMIDASHDYIMNRIGNKVIWYFDYIQLPGAVVNEALSHGYVTFRIKLKPGFSIGDIVPNQADIYFDTNPPITTNTFQTEFVTQLSAPDFGSSNILVYPNPGNGNIQVSLSQTAETIRSVALYDVLGKCVKKAAVGSSSTFVNVSNLAIGVYMIEIITGNDLKVIKKLVVK